MKFKFLISNIALLLLIGCSTTTAEFKNEMNICTMDAWKKFPQRIVRELRNVDVPQKTPTSIYCDPPRYDGDAPYCTQQYKTTYITVAKLVDVDTNENERNQNIRMCTYTKCAEKYGNADCKIEKK